MKFKIEKRDGTLVGFNSLKIKAAIEKAFLSLRIEVEEDILELLTLRAIADFLERTDDTKISVETIQDSAVDRKSVCRERV